MIGIQRFSDVREVGIFKGEVVKGEMCSGLYVKGAAG